MRYEGKLRVGAVYQSLGIRGMRRRIESIRHGIVKYAIYRPDGIPLTENEVTEQQFRDITSHEIPVEVLNKESAAYAAASQRISS